ncbi:helicase RepA family protein [Vibrio breoganii]
MNYPAFNNPMSHTGLRAPAFKWGRGSDGYNSNIDYLLDGMIPVHSFGVLYGPSGSYKSFLVMSWCAHISSGKNWDGRSVRKAGVLYVVAEGGIGAPRRVKAWEIANMQGQQLENFFVVNEPVHIANPNAEAMLEATITDIEKKCNTKIELVVFDTLARCFNGADENSTKDMNFFISGCDTLKANRGVTVLVVHHSGKHEANAARGSSALRAACDFEFKVTKSDTAGDSRSLILSCEKMKDDEPASMSTYELNPVSLFKNQCGKDISSLVVLSQGELVDIDSLKSGSTNAMSEPQSVIWGIIRSRIARGDSSTRDLIRDDFKSLGYQTKNFGRTLSKLLESGKVSEKDGQYICT